MDLVQAVILALLQGVVEFLPISSSGHLILVPAFLGWQDQGLAFDIAVHLGTLSAVVLYFKRDIRSMTVALFGRSGAGAPEARLAWGIIVATVPLGIAGILMADLVAGVLRSPAIIAATTAGFGVVLWLADRYTRGHRTERELAWTDIAVIGFAQVLALVPGTSRSGITMTAGLALGLSRAAAARFSFLLAIPAIGMASAWQLMQFAAEPGPTPWGLLALATAVSALTAFAAIAVFLRVIERIGLWVFAVYRLILAGVIAYALL